VLVLFPMEKDMGGKSDCTTFENWPVDLRVTGGTPALPPDIVCACSTETEAIREMWKRYEFIVNTSMDFMNLIDRNYIYQTVNNAFLSTLNKTREEVIGKNVADIWGRQTFALSIKPCFDQCFAGNIVQTDFSIDIPKRGLSYFHTIYYPYYNADKVVTHAVVVSHDVTDRTQVENQAHKLSQAVTLSGASIMLTGKDGIIEYINPSFEKMTGYKAEEVIGHTLRILKSGKHNAAFYEDMWHTITHGNVWHGKVINRKKKGRALPCHANHCAYYG